MIIESNTWTRSASASLKGAPMRSHFALVATLVLASVAHAQEFDCNDADAIGADAVKDCLLTDGKRWEDCFCEADDQERLSEGQLRNLLAQAFGIQDSDTPANPFAFRNIWAPLPYRHLLERHHEDSTLMGGSTAFSAALEPYRD